MTPEPDSSDSSAVAVQLPPDAAAPAPQPFAAAAVSGQPRAILLESNAFHRLVLSRMLRNAGWEVEIADPARELSPAAGECELVLIDCDSPEPDGFAAASRLRGAGETSRRVPVVALTSGVSQADRKKRKAAGFDNYLQKPVRQEKLNVLLARYAPALRQQEPPPMTALDSSRIDELVAVMGGDAGSVREIFDTFLIATPRLLERLRRADEDSDAATLVRAAAALRSTSALLGAGRMAEICNLIGALAHAGSLAGVSALIGELALAFERVSCDLRSVEIELLQNPPKPPAAGEQGGAAAPPARSGPLRVLLAGNDALLARFLAANFRSGGFETEHCGDGTAAQPLVRAKRFDAVVLQAGVPGWDGYELLSAIRLEPDLRGMPVVVLSPRRQEEDVLRAFELGADDFVPVPLNPLEVVARVRRLLRRR